MQQEQVVGQVQRGAQLEGELARVRVRRQLARVHGGLEDGDLCWESLAPRLSERFTCYLMSRRSRGLSGEHPDLSPQRLLEDVTAFVASIDGPVRLLGESDGGPLALGAAAQVPAVVAIAVYEPVVLEVAGEEVVSRLDDTLPRVAHAAAEARMGDAARTFTEMLANDDELAALSASEYFEACARYVPTLLGELEQIDRSDGPSPTSSSSCWTRRERARLGVGRFSPGTARLTAPRR